LFGVHSVPAIDLSVQGSRALHVALCGLERNAKRRSLAGDPCLQASNEFHEEYLAAFGTKEVD
jgi:hypothetical protein